MRQPTVVRAQVKETRHATSKVDIASLSEAELRDLYMRIYGEPSDQEIAAALRRAESEFAVGNYTPPADDFDEDEPYRQPTKQEILDGIATGYKQALAGDVRPIEDLLEELEVDDG